jgi:hypothetical protein
MKLTNHHKENSYTHNTYVMRGTIEMTREEYANAFQWLCRMYEKAVKECNTYVRDGLSSLLLQKDTQIFFSLGVTATKMIAKKYGLKNYKDVNYCIRII